MLIPRRRTMEMFSISALDLFASALGTFILLAILLFPYYLRQPSLEIELAGARAELSASGESLQDAERKAEAEALRVAQANAALARAREILQQAEVEAAAAADLEQSTPAADPSEDERPVSRLAINDLDLVFVMDTTGSMRNELADVQANLLGVIRVLHRLAPSLRVGFVAFKDHGAEYVTRSFPLSPMSQDNVANVIRFVGGMSAEGGGDDPEPVDEALAVAMAMDWRADAQGQILVIGDAPPRSPGRGHALALAEQFRGSAPDPTLPRTVSAIYTGPAGGHVFFEQVARAGGGDFSAYQGQIIENVLLSVLRDPGAQASR
jgi:Mg-chelatase subunit ChlD